jgi:hypothetical protein
MVETYNPEAVATVIEGFAQKGKTQPQINADNADQT